MNVFSGSETLRLHGEALVLGADLPTRTSLVLDAPWGYALHLLPRIPRPVLVVTNGSPHYLSDLLELEPEGLIAHVATPALVLDVLTRVAGGERLHLVPPLTDTGIQPCERKVLRLVALGWQNREIAEHLGISLRTVENRITALLEKLSLRNRAELVLEYFGMHPRGWAGWKLPFQEG